MLCIDCRKLVIDYSKLDDGWISTEYDRSDTYPDLPSLRLSARNGSEFCQVLISGIETTLKQNIYCEDASVQKIDLHKADFTTEGYLSSGLEEEEDGVYEMLLQIKAPSLSSIPLHLAISADEGTLFQRQAYLILISIQLLQRPSMAEFVADQLVLVSIGPLAWILCTTGSMSAVRITMHATPRRRQISFQHE